MRKVLIISSSFFPDPVVGAVRATQWAKLLPEQEWQVVVARKHHGYTATMEEMAQSVHPDVKVHFISDAPSAFSAQRLGRFAATKKAFANAMGRYILAPDTGIVFWKKISGKLVKLVEEVRPDVVITTGPPQSIHTVGMHLKTMFPSLQWIADFRDVYSTEMRDDAGWMEFYRIRKSLRYEAEVYQKADHITCTFPAHQRWMRQKFPCTADKTTIVTNGVPSEICQLELSAGWTRQPYWVKVVGFSEAPASVTLAKAVALLRKTGEDIGLRIVGTSPSVKADVEKALGEGVEFTGRVPHAQALLEVATARVLVAVLSEERSRIPAIASKLFEYLAVPAPVVILNPSNAARTMFSRMPGVWMLTKPTPADIEAALQAALAMPVDALSARAALVREKWSRRSQVAQLASILDDLAKRRDMPPEPQQAASSR